MGIPNVAIIMLMFIFIRPAIVHAYTLEMLGAETTHAIVGGCHDTANKAGHDKTHNHQFYVLCCELDTSYVLPSSQYFTTPAVTGTLTCPSNGRQLDGYFRRIFKPPRYPYSVIRKGNSENGPAYL